jgi:hypothetical protein
MSTVSLRIQEGNGKKCFRVNNEQENVEVEAAFNDFVDIIDMMTTCFGV